MAFVFILSYGKQFCNVLPLLKTLSDKELTGWGHDLHLASCWRE